MSSITIKRSFGPDPAGTTVHDAIDLTSEDEHTRTPRVPSSDPLLLATTPLKNRWTSPQRIWLFFVVRRYQNSWADVAKLFNYAFKAHLHRMGFNNDFPKDSVSSQFLEGPRKQGSDFIHVLTTPFQDLERKFNGTLTSVLQAALKQGVQLNPRSKDNWLANYTMATPAKRKRRNSTTTNSDDEEVHAQDTEDEEDSGQRTPLHKARRNAVQSFPRAPLTKQAFMTPKESACTRQLPSPPSFTNTTPVSSRSSDLRAKAILTPETPKGALGGLLTDGDGLPYLLFRAWDGTSHGENTSRGFAAGLQLDAGFPLEEDDLCFLQYAENHISELPIDSPLISLTASFISGVKKALKKASTQSMSATKEEIKIAILDTRIVANNTRLYHANPTIRELAKQKRLRYPYYGRFEFWAWQQAQGVIGETTLADFEAWIDNDHCLGRLFQTYDLSRCSVMTFRERCSESRVQLDEEFARSVASLAKLFRPNTSFSHPFLKDFTRTIIQNLDLSKDLRSFFEDTSFCAALKETLQARSQLPQAPSRLTKETLATHISSRANESIREWSTTSSLFQDLAHIRQGHHSKRSGGEVEEDDITAKADSEIDDDVIDLDDDDDDDDDDDQQSINTPSTDSEAVCLLRRFTRLRTPSTPSPNGNGAGEAILIEDDDNIDAPSNITEARSLLDQFRRQATPLRPLSSRIKLASLLATPSPKALLRSPYESAKDSLGRTSFESPSSPLVSRKPGVTRAFRAPPTTATTTAAAALHDSVNAQWVASAPELNKRKFSVITAADRDAAMQGMM